MGLSSWLASGHHHVWEETIVGLVLCCSSFKGPNPIVKAHSYDLI